MGNENKVASYLARMVYGSNVQRGAADAETADARPHSALATLSPGSCLLACEADEPVFVLCGRDPLALQFVEMWAAQKAEELNQATERYREALAMPKGPHREEAMSSAWNEASRLRAKVNGAREVVQAFENWQTRKPAAAAQ